MQKNDTPNHQKSRVDGQEHTQLTAGGTPVAGEFNLGDIIGGDYQVLRWIGAGGMGNVYHVRHTIMHADYALKTLSADKVTEVAWRRFQNEAQAIARMSHPNIVGIYNLGLHDGRLPFYVMDLLKGQSLQDILRDNGPMDVNLALSLFVELCSGFGYAHKKGIVHRDIKPPNIVLLDSPEPSCRAKIVDFGIAKLSGVKDPKNQYLTNIGEVCGSPYYMSPEQTEGQRIDARSDIYSLGCSLFEVLTGAPPLRGRTAVDTMLMHSTTAPPTLRAASGGKEFPEMLESVVATLLAKAPMDRYQTMELVAQDLVTILAGNQAAISPYASQAIKLIPAAETMDNQNRLTAAGRRTEPSLPHRRRYEEAGGEESEEQGKNSRLPLIVIACATIVTAMVLVGGGLWWQKQVKPKSLPAPVTLAAPLKDLEDDHNILLATETHSSATRAAKRAEANRTPPTVSLKDTTPYCQIRINKGQRYRVFHFPTDFVIGDISSAQLGSFREAKGEVICGADEYVHFSPDILLLKYPGYLQRFRPGDVQTLKIDGSYVTNDLVKLATTLPGLVKVDFEDCPNVTAQVIPYVDKIPGLNELEINDHALKAADLTQLTKINRLKYLSFCNLDNTDSYLRLVKNSQAVRDLALSHSRVSRQGFEYIAGMTNLQSLRLADAHFAAEDLALLSTLKHLNGVAIEDLTIDQKLLTSLKKLKSLKELSMTDGKKGSLTIEQIRFYLKPVMITPEARAEDAMPAKMGL